MPPTALRTSQLHKEITGRDAERLTRGAGPAFSLGMFSVWCGELAERAGTHSDPLRHAMPVDEKGRASGAHSDVPESWRGSVQFWSALFNDFDAVHALYANLSGLATVEAAVERQDRSVLEECQSTIHQLLDATGREVAGLERRLHDASPAQHVWGVMHGRLTADLVMLQQARALCSGPGNLDSSRPAWWVVRAAASWPAKSLAAWGNARR